MYMKDTGQLASSTYYMQQHPAWVNAFNAWRPADRFFRATWKPLLPDGQPWYSKRGEACW